MKSILIFHDYFVLLTFKEFLASRSTTKIFMFTCHHYLTRVKFVLVFIFRYGHSLMAFRLSRVCSSVDPEKTLELGHHILKANIYKNLCRQSQFSSRVFLAYWMCLCSDNLNAALVSQRNLFSPNVKVRLVHFPWILIEKTQIYFFLLVQNGGVRSHNGEKYNW